MKTSSTLQRWFWGSVIGIGLVSTSIVLFYLLNPNSGITPTPPEENERSEAQPENIALEPIDTESLFAIKTDTTLAQTFPKGSVEEACGLHEFPPYKKNYRDKFGDFNKEDLLKRVFASKECRNALETRVGAINPYLWGNHSFWYQRQFSFVVIEDPLTFDRIFADPSGDFAMVQDALSRSECLLENGTTMNFELSQSCSADALLNYALLNRYCFFGETSSRTYLQKNLTPVQSRDMWTLDLQELWIRTKCKEFDPELRLTEDRYPELTKLLSSLVNRKSLRFKLLEHQRSRFPERTYSEILPRSFWISTLIEMAARLGDEAAALASRSPFWDEGANLGRFRELEFEPAWREIRLKREPSQDRLLLTFHFLSEIASLDIELNWDSLVRHLCEPPYPYDELDPQTAGSYSEWQEKSSEPLSCRAVINEFYIDGDLSDSVLEVIDRFERTAMRLDLYH